MATRKIKDQVQTSQNVSVIDLLLFDHRFVKQCIEVFQDDTADKIKKLTLSRGFLEAVQKHSIAEKKAVYSKLTSNKELHFIILEAEIEHGIVDQKVKSLKNKVARVRVLKDEVEAELKVLADLLQHHLREEESEMFPKMQEAIDEATLMEMGTDFMQLRNITPQDLTDYPMLQDELIQWKDSVQKISSQFLSKMDKYVENLKH
ncbi:MAG TPA: hemerythrin domain-containing protein [Bacteriovoracaceae bacterium]|nr:hemerythrin domain-containing protein [Bacteriovoracaceae bacterium]